MLTPRTWTRALHRSRRASVLAALLAILACSKDGDHYSPLPNNPSPQATVVAGAVRDGSDHAVADALVVIEPVREGVTATIQHQVENPGAASASTPGRRVTVTGDNGSFAFDDVDTGEYFLQVIADDHLGAMRSLSVPDPKALIDTVFVDVDLTPTGTFTGVATLENATQHQGTVVYAEGTSYVAVTDPTGAYALTDVPVGTYTVRAEHAHYLEDTENGTITTAGEIVPLAAMLLRIDSNIPPVATIASASPEVQNVPVQFVASGTDADGSVVLYEWDWEDDGIFDYSNASTANTSHTYSVEGDVTAKLRVTDNDGAIGLAVVQLSISSNVAPTATIVSASPQLDGTPVQFVANGSDGDGVIVLYEWDWEDNGSYDSSSGSSGNASHLYLPGNYTARFRVTDDDGATDEETIALVIVRAQIFMSPTGNDAQPGTAALPVATLSVAYTRAQFYGIDEVYILEGSYSGAPTFVSGIDVRGGRQLPYWTEGGSYSFFSFTGAARGTANNITTATTIRKVALTLLVPSGSANAIALYSLGASSNLRFEDCQFTAPNASSPGAAGAAGTPGAIGSTGNGGANGSCDGNIIAPGGTGGSSPSGCPGGSGGNGGPAGSNPGSSGFIGACGGGSGGVGGSGGDPGGPGGIGANGAAGTLGAGGFSASGSGSIVANEWVPAVSGTGVSGTSGRGGGGGGGGGGQGCTFCDDGAGNGGGGGGGGAAGGGGGQGGTGGRASFAVLLVNSSPQFVSCHFQSGNGGLGGNGGSGAGGGTGGGGGPGAVVCTGEVGAGGNGGTGGNGGSGGGGAGGPGGPSYGVFKGGSSAPTISSSIFTIGSGGSGGTGGSPNGQNGAGGPSGNTN